MPSKGSSTSRTARPEQTSSELAVLIEEFFANHADAAVFEDGKPLFDLRTAKYTVSTDHGRCTLHLWSEEANMVRRVLSAENKAGVLRVATARFGQAQPKLLEITSSSTWRTSTTRDAARRRYLKTLERVLARNFPEYKPYAFSTAMDLERSFGPAYARGSLVRGNKAWAVIGVGEHESPTIIDGILTLGILWLHHCREQASGRKLYQGLKIVVPRGMATLTLSRLAWMNHDAAQWKLHELDGKNEELTERDAADTGNLLTRLVHRPDESTTRERFGEAVEQVKALTPEGEWDRVEQHLRSSTELAFLLHGLEFARAHVRPAQNSFTHFVEITVGAGQNETLLTEHTRADLVHLVSDLFHRRRAVVVQPNFADRGHAPSRRIGANTSLPAHSRLQTTPPAAKENYNPTQDPLYRAAPERWLESVLRHDLSPLTRGLASAKGDAERAQERSLAVDDTRGNRAEVHEPEQAVVTANIVPRLDPHHVYTQVPAIAGASDRGMLDLLSVTADGRLAVIELKADDDLHFALQGLDYWIRVRHHHRQTADPATGMGEFQRHGYFRGIELSSFDPRLYLVAPALHIHPATELVLRYISRRIEWHLLALDERWRQGVRVVWRKSNNG